MPQQSNIDCVLESMKVLSEIDLMSRQWNYRITKSKHQLVIHMMHPLTDRDAVMTHTIWLDALESSGLLFLHRSISELEGRFIRHIHEQKRRELKQRLRKEERENKASVK